MKYTIPLILASFCVCRTELVAKGGSEYVLSCTIANEEQWSELLKRVHEHDIDLWDEVAPSGSGEVTMAGPLSVLSPIINSFNCADPLADNIYVEKLLEAQSEDKTTAEPVDGFHTSFHRFPQIMDQMDVLQRGAPRNTSVSIETIGKSYQGRALEVLKITSAEESREVKGTKTKIWVSCGQHAREWIAPAACLVAADALINESDSNPRIAHLLRKHEVYIMPLVNPDGYEYTSVDRLWRKNRRPVNKQSIGVDLNRNWDAYWGVVGASIDPSSSVFQGPAAGSEPEVQAISNYVISKGGFLFGLDVHSFGEWVLRNPSWTTKATPLEKYLQGAGDAAAANMNKLYGEKYKSRLSSFLYPTGGSMDDWFLYTAGFPGYTMEMRDNGNYKFIAPPAHIIPTGKELIEAILTISKYFEQNPIPKV